jgi:hypothetical protein
LPSRIGPGESPVDQIWRRLRLLILGVIASTFQSSLLRSYRNLDYPKSSVAIIVTNFP